MNDQELQALTDLTSALNSLAKQYARSNSLKGQKARGKALVQGIIEGLEEKNLMDRITKILKGEIEKPIQPWPQVQIQPAQPTPTVPFPTVPFPTIPYITPNTTYVRASQATIHKLEKRIAELRVLNENHGH